VVLDPLFWDQSISTFPRRAVLAMVETTKDDMHRVAVASG